VTSGEYETTKFALYSRGASNRHAAVTRAGTAGDMGVFPIVLGREVYQVILPIFSYIQFVGVGFNVKWMYVIS
jgi:hypothetical protein